MSPITRRDVLGGALASGLAAVVPGAASSQQASPQEPAFAVQPSRTEISQPRLTGIRRVIVDTDPGNDDALAILLCLASPNLQVEAFTVCPGNMGPRYEQQLKNALYILDVAGKSGKYPVHAGMDRPLLNLPYPVATFIHGKYGLGSVEVTDVQQKVEDEHAVDAMRRIVKQSPGEITILALGGLTNVAMAMLRDAQMTKALKGIVFVGGHYSSPGMAPSYNVLVDPEAAHIVFTSGVPLTLVGADVSSHDSIMQDADFDHVARFKNRKSEFFIQSNTLRRTFEKSHRGTTGSTNPDPITVSLAINPAIGLHYVPLFMQVERQGALTRGQLVYGNDIYTGNPTPPPNVDICVQASSALFKQLVFDTLSQA
jgi:inosine-uridine nucleoside N-ribohydrolase